jgi:dipeptidyl aminopeptidase/acylaminoacyl peptidase
MMASRLLQQRSFVACFVLGFSGLLTMAFPEVAIAQTATRRFTVADDIGLNQLGGIVLFSPDDRYFIVTSDRGRLDLNRCESSLRVYSTEEVHRALSRSDTANEPPPFWTISKSTYKDGPIISRVQWLPDSTGFVFLAKTPSGNDQLFLANIRTKALQALTNEDQRVMAFDVRSASHYVYCVMSPAIKRQVAESRQASAIAGTGYDIYTLMYPQDSLQFSDLSELWAVLDGKRFRVVDASSRHPLAIHQEGQWALALSPDGRSVVTALPVSDIPPAWETLYPPPTPTSAYRVRAGRQNPDAFAGWSDVSEYVSVDLASGKIKPLIHAPTGTNTGWVGSSLAAWSADGRSVVLANTFLPLHTPGSAEQANRPCVVVADLVAGSLTCLERRKEQTEHKDKESWRVDNLHFASGTSMRVIVRHESGESTTYSQLNDGSWSPDATADDSVPKSHSIDISVKQGLNDPPVLVASDKTAKNSRIIWNPNPQLKDIQLGEVSVFKWKDKNAHDWLGGLYKPPDYVTGKLYPLVIQTHGFDEHEFQPGGAYPTAFAAQELAAAGFLVLQVEDCDFPATPEEGPCQVAGYEAAVEQLSSAGLVDPDRVGIVGFSRTCYYTLQALTTSTLRFKAASITDGFNEGYWQYIMQVDNGDNGFAHEEDVMVGAAPFGAGLVQWLKRSPEFNMDKVQAPLQVVALGRPDVLFMWEPYGTLRYLKKPVDLIVLDSDEHILTNPAARMASQGGTVDWFRFWLEGEEDPDPAKATQYKRWQDLQQLGKRDSERLAVPASVELTPRKRHVAR